MSEAPRIDFLGLPLSPLEEQQFLALLFQWARGKQKRLITYLNAHCTNVAFKDARYWQILQDADLLYADGQSIVWAARLLGKKVPCRLTAADFFLHFCQLASERGVRLFFLGAQPQVLEQMRRRLLERFPQLQIAGSQHGFFAPRETRQVLESIRGASADVVIVGMGIPLQEKWVKENWEQLPAVVCWCVGALFDYYGGLHRRAPGLFRRCGMEWLFRLVQEPGRLWRRYLIGNLEFSLRIIKYRLKGHS